MTEMTTSKTTARAAARSLLAAVLALAACAALAPSALGASTGRTYVEQVGFGQPEEVYVTPTDKLLVSDVSKGEMLEYSLAPGIQKTGSMPSQGFWGGSTQVHSIAESAANNYRYVATDGEELVSGGACGGTPFTIFDNYGKSYKSHREDFICAAFVTVDNNPQSENYGHYFFYAEGAVEQFDGYGNPANFSGSASYIEGNRLTGTPFAESLDNGGGQPAGAGITIDEEGNIWLINNKYPYEGGAEIDEFSSSGQFIQRINEATSGAPEVTNQSGTHPWGEYPGPQGIAIDPTNGDVVISDKGNNVVDEFTHAGKYIGAITAADTPQGSFKSVCRLPTFCFNHVDGIAIDKNGYLYIADGFGGVVDVYSPRPKQPKIAYKPETNPTTTSATLNAVVDPAGGGDVTSCKFEVGTTTGYSLGSFPCTPDPSGSSFSAPTEVHADISGLTAETTYHYRVVAGNASATGFGADRTFTPHKVLGLRADAATAVSSAGATLNGSFVGNGSHTTYWFEYGTSTAYGSKVPTPAPPGGDAGSPTGPGRAQLSASVSGLNPATTYHYRVVAENGALSRSEDLTFRTSPLLPRVIKENVTSVHSDQLDLNAQISPGGADTTYEFEFGTEPCSNEPDPCATPFLVRHVGSNLNFFPVTQHVEGLQPGTTYYYRVIATNSAGTEYGRDRTFSTYRFLDELKDACPNALARQQTGAALVTDCRGYELVSSASAGGYDVESTLVSSQTPFEGYPRAESPLRVLYGIHSGAIPGIEGEPTNRGVDPYVATRGAEGWTTSYVGIPANNPFASTPFSSTLSEADQALDTFAFAGPEICTPCFADGTTGVPLHRADGGLEQGMQGSVTPSTPALEDGLVKQRFSGDGKHFVFASTSQFADGGNDSTGDASIYDRDLETNQTQVVSTDENGDPLTCLQGAGSCHAPGDAAGISELGISQDGSRIVVGQKVSTDSAGNDYYRLYMHEGDSADSIPLTPGATNGVLFDGMTADGSHVFFTTVDALGGGDADTSADIYEAAIENGAAVLRLLSTDGGSASNDDSCGTVGSPNTWNAVSGNGKCGAVAFAGGAGVASESGALFFMSPELLDAAAEAEGEEGQVNLYLVKPGGSPQFVATIDSTTPKPAPAAINNPAVLHAVNDSGTHHWSDFQVTPSGEYAAFSTSLELDEGYENLEYSEVYRYAAGDGELNCVSCPPTNALATGDATLAKNGLSLVDDGRVFFDSKQAIVLRDGDGTKDVYEWEKEGDGPNPGSCESENPNYFPTGVCLSLISSGTSPFDSSLLSATADGSDAFFFTHDSLARGDENGPVTKIYDARTDGGIFRIPAPAECAASDECHGPGSKEAQTPPIRTIAATPGNPKNVTCKKPRVKRNGKCVAKKKTKHHKRHHRRHHHRGAR